MAKQKLMTKTIAKTIPRLYATDGMSDHMKRVPVKFFNPTSAYTYYVIEYDPDQRLLFGYVTGTEFDELGYQSLDELENYKGKFGLGIERDIHWNPRTNLAEVKGEPSTLGSTFGTDSDPRIPSPSEPFTLDDYKHNENWNHHGENAAILVNRFGSTEEAKIIAAINDRHRAEGGISREDQNARDKIATKYYKQYFQFSHSDGPTEKPVATVFKKRQARKKPARSRGHNFRRRGM